MNQDDQNQQDAHPATEQQNEVIVARSEIEQLDSRLRQIEKITQTIESISKSAIDAATSYLQNKAETERKEAESRNARHAREITLKDKLHKRSIVALLFIVTIVAILVGTAVAFGEAELAKTILLASLALAGGAGIRNLFRTEDEK